MIVSKKAITAVLTIALAVIIFVVSVAFYKYFFGGLGESGKDITAYTGDFDQDGTINGPKGSYTKAPGLDACPCISGDIKNDGCPLNHKIIGENKGLEDRSCLSKLT